MLDHLRQLGHHVLPSFQSLYDWKRKAPFSDTETMQVLTFADAMPNCGIWIEDEHAFDPSEVDGSNLDCMV